MSRWHRETDEVRMEIACAVGDGRDILEALEPEQRELETRLLEDRLPTTLQPNAYDRLEWVHEPYRGYTDD